MERERPWHEDEKVHLLTEILRASNADPVDVLWNYARANAISPAWGDIVLPKGRTLNQCQRWYHDLQGRPTFIHTSGPPTLSPFLNPAAGIPRKRALALDAQTPTGRPIQPKLPYTFPTDLAGHVPLSPAEPQKETTKRRGRPTKAEVERRRQEAIGRGEVYPPLKSSKGQRPPTAPGGTETHPQPPTPGIAPTTRMTPPTTKPEVGSESSSGKRRRGARPAKAETTEEEVKVRSEGITSAYESPPHTGPLQSEGGVGSVSAGPASGPLASPAAAERSDREIQEEGREPPRRIWE